MITGIRGQQSKGKTALMVASIIELLIFGGYQPDEVVVNFALHIPGVHCIPNDKMRQFLKMMIERGLKHKIIGITEIDRMLPARFWHQAEQTDTLLGLWQDEKLFNWIFWDAHIGSSVDLMLRQTTQIELLPEYEKVNDRILFTVINTLNRESHEETCDNVSKRVFPFYNRWEVIK